MNGVSNYGMSMNSQVNFQGKGKLSGNQVNKLTNGIKENIIEQQKATQKYINTTRELFNEFQKGQITEKEMLKILESIEGKTKGLNVMG